MRIELIPGLDKVIRFPVERRVPATLELLYEIAPDVREVLNVAEAFRLEAPDPDLYQRADLATAERILDQVPREPGSQRRQMLDDLRQAVITEAVAACRARCRGGCQRGASTPAAAQTARSWRGDIEHLSAQADRLTQQVAELLAHALVQHALGANRAIELACRGESWTPRSTEDDMLWLVGSPLSG